MRMFVVIAALLCHLPGCGSGIPNTETLAATNTVVEHGVPLRTLGKLFSNDKELIVTATRRSTSIVDYEVTRVDSGVCLAKGGGFSDAQGWFLLWDDAGNLWAYNSDIGGFGYWTLTSESRMEFTDVGKQTPESTIPDFVMDNLPRVIKRHFGWDGVQ